MSYKTIDYQPLMKNGITREMLMAIGLKAYGVDEPLTNEDGSFIHSFKWELQDALLARSGNKTVNVVYGRHWFANIYLERGYNPSESFVIKEIQKKILEEAHVTDRCLNGLSQAVRYCYSNMRADTRPDGSYVYLTSSFAVAIRKEPVWRSDLDDVGPQKSGNELSNLIHRFVPEATHSQVLHLINSYRDQWQGIYGGNPALIYGFTKQKPAGEQLFLTVGAGKLAVTFQFNRINVLNKDTLRPDTQTLSLTKDFQ